MPGFTPITTPEQLPDEETSLETLDRDFKRLVPGTGLPDRAELAKDVAAFANRIGGVLIFAGVDEVSNVAIFESREASTGKFMVALDAIESVWCDDGVWQVARRGWNSP